MDNAIFAILSVFTLLAYMFYRSFENDSTENSNKRKQEKKLLEERNLQLLAARAEQEKIPKSAILFETEEGFKVSHKLNPQVYMTGGGVEVEDSKTRAKEYLEQSYKDGYFKDNLDNTYPASRIKRAKVVQVNSES